MVKKIIQLFFSILLRALHIAPLYRFFKKYKVLFFLLLALPALLGIKWLYSFELKEIMEYKKFLLHSAHDNPFVVGLAFFFTYLFVAVLSLPGTAFFNVIGGFLFGFVKGTVLSIFAVSIGSSIAFLLSRFFLRDFFIKRGGDKMQKAFSLLEKDDVYYLFAFRLFPFTPLFFTNMIMGLSSIKLSVFYIISFISLLPLLAIYANMGSQLSHLETWEGLMSFEILAAFGLVGLFPLLMKYLLKFFKRFKKNKEDLVLDSGGSLIG